MRHFYFWQNMVSMHQSAFIRELSNVKDTAVTLIVEEYLFEERKTMGWSMPDHGKVVIRSFEEEELDWKGIVDNSDRNNSYHIFSGIGAFRKNHQAFKHAVRKGYKIGIMAEPLDYRGWKGALRLMIARKNKILFEKSIHFWLAISEKAYSQYHKVGYPLKKLYSWAYCVEPVSYDKREIQAEPPPNYRIMFAGSFSHRKGYDILIGALKDLGTLDFVADFYSVAPDEKDKAAEVWTESGLGAKLNLKEMIDNGSLRKQMANYDLFVLPSRFDGWGAVINEALMAGTPVIVSNACGASTLVKYNPDIGWICNADDKDDLVTKLSNQMNKGKWSEEERQNLRKWAEAHISGAALVPYFLEIIKTVESGATKPTEPWRGQ